MSSTASPPESQTRLLLAMLNQGRWADVIAQAQALVRQYPGSALLWNILGSASAQGGQYELAVKALAEANRLHPDQFQTLNNLGNVLQYLGRLDQAIACYQRVLMLRPDLAPVHNNLGDALAQVGRPQEAAECYRRALAKAPNDAAMHAKLGDLLRQLRQPDAAIASYQRALTLKPDHAVCHFHVGCMFQEQGRLDDALISFQRVQTLLPTWAEGFYHVGQVLRLQGRIDAAIGAFQQAMALKPENANANIQIGNGFYELERFAAAAACYERALTFEPDRVDVRGILGVVLQKLGRFDQAIAQYHKALSLNPGYAEGYNNLGTVLNDMGRTDDAMAAYRKAVALNPGYAETHLNIGNLLNEQGKRDEAIAAYEQALALRPDYVEAEAHLLHQRNYICDWRDHQAIAARFQRLVSHQDVCPTFDLLPLADDPAGQLQASRKWAARRFRDAPLPTEQKSGMQAKAWPRRLRIGYFSSDFHDHATLFLMSGLLREHDKSQFEIFAYNYGRNPPGAWGESARTQFDQFFEVADHPSSAIVGLARSHDLDIAIDLKGYTANTRVDIFQHRLAPLQISYLGYPGSLGTDFIDYMVADPIVIPDAERAFYSEHVIYLPDSYQPNDNTRAIAETHGSRSDFGLPADGLVFCCFNNSYKISPREFAIWMRVLGQVKGSVLWLLRSSPSCENNLRREAVARGIAADRLVFADRTGQASHLARHRHADIFLDTFAVNAHTTASDALWAGLPIVTKIGRQFAARVSASLLTAVGLPDLITETDEAYEALILDLAGNPARLAHIKARLAANRHDHPLFDTVRYTRHFEAGLIKAYERIRDGLPPHDIRIEA